MTVIYFIKCIVSMGICWSLYKMLLANKKSFLFNRGFLLVSIVGLAFVPFLSLPSSVAPVVKPMLPQLETLVTYAVEFNETPAEVIAPIVTERVITTTFHWIWLFYIVGFVLLLRIIFNIAKLSIAAYRNLHHSDGQVQVIDSNYKNTPFSFFNNLFLSSEQMEEGLPEEVLAHELCHINHFHSIDRIVVELILLIQWWNPFAHLLIRSLKENHEYTADDYALRSKGQSNRLIEQLLSYSSEENSNQLFQIGFAQSAVMKRIRMISSQEKRLSRIGVVLSTMLIILISLSCSDLTEDIVLDDYVEVTTIEDHLSGIKYQFPVSLVNRVPNTHRLRALPEYRSPSVQLFKKFKTDSKFEILLDGNEIKASERKLLTYNNIKSFKVYDVSHLESGVDFKAELYTKKGYFEAMEIWIESISMKIREMEEMAKKYNIDLMDTSFAKYNKNGGAPDSEIPKKKKITEAFFSKLKDPSKYKVKIDYDIISNSDLVNRDPSEFSYYIMDKITIERRVVEINLITNSKYEHYVYLMKNGWSEEVKAGLKRAKTRSNQKDLQNISN